MLPLISHQIRGFLRPASWRSREAPSRQTIRHGFGEPLHNLAAFLTVSNSKYPPAEPGALRCEPLKAA
jgi:hypothetical protein